MNIFSYYFLELLFFGLKFVMSVKFIIGFKLN